MEAGGIFGVIKNAATGVLSRLKSFFLNKTFLIFAAAFAALGVFSVLGTVIYIKSRPVKALKSEAPLFEVKKIETSDIFIPNEPDFLPQAVFEQEQKKVWTEEDIERYWTDPREAGETVLLERLGGIVDRLLERFP